jgi:hypothetical protein
MTDSTDMPLELQPLRAPARRRSGGRRSELERLVDRTVLGPTHPELGTCWLFTGTTTPYGRIAKAQDRTATRTGSAGSSFAATFQETRSFIIGAASMRAGTQTILSSSPTPRTNCTCARPTASTATRCPVTICGSARTECEPAGRATRPTSVPSGSATPAGTTLARNPHSLRYVNRSADAASPTSCRSL